MFLYEKEPNIKEVTEQLYGLLNYQQVEEFPDYEAKTYNEQLYILDRLLHLLERSGYGKDKQAGVAFQAARHFVGKD